MEYMPNGSLFHLLHNKQTIQWDVRMRFAIDMARGLVYLHEENIVHRDIKSLNVLLDEHLKAKLTDFGLSKVKTETRSVSTKSSQSVGTIPWMAPELFSRRAVYTKKSDIYSLGMTFWELASCEIPFKDAASTELIPGWVKDGEREEIPLDCPQKLGSLIKACWEGVPDNRPDATTVAEFLLSQETNFAAFLPGYQSRAKSQPAMSSGYQSNLSSAAAASPAKMPSSSSSSGYYNNQYSAVNKSPTVSPSPSPAMLVPDFQQKLQITKPAAVPTINIAEVKNFLKLVADGEQDQAEALLKETPELALYPIDVMDLAGRSFKNITGFQYAVWALDWHMWMMIRKYLPNDKAAEQVQSMKNGSWVSQHGVSASWQNLLNALQKFTDLCNATMWSEAGTQWNKQVGGAQRFLPMHVVNEYCRADRPFEPCPDFNSTVPLPRTRMTDKDE
jgi:serine/threonine protein kinase